MNKHKFSHKHYGKTTFVVLAFVFIGIVFVIWSKAATVSVQVEPESSFLSGGVKIGNSSSASNGKYVLFTPSVGFSTYDNNAGSLANELNVASNGAWSWGSSGLLSGGADEYRVTMNAPVASGENYYWSSVFRWSNNSTGGGYIGVQTKVYPVNGQRGGVFSVWDTTVAEAVGDGVAQPFGGEGIGMQTGRPFAWEWNKQYEYLVQRDSSRSDANYNWWRGFILEKSTQAGWEVGRIRTPTSWGKPIPNYTFLERYGHTNTCGQISPVSGEFTDLKATSNGQLVRATQVAVELRKYSDCANVISASSIGGGYKVNISPGNP